jgi:hypothetical protein
MINELVKKVVNESSAYLAENMELIERAIKEAQPPDSETLAEASVTLSVRIIKDGDELVTVTSFSASPKIKYSNKTDRKRISNHPDMFDGDPICNSTMPDSYVPPQDR